jgi:signal transduction histidine kinase
MVQEIPSSETAFLATQPPNPREKRLALTVVIVSAVFFLLAAPFAKHPLPKVWAFIPIYESALVTNDLITAAILFGQYRILRSRSLCVLACGYLFTACVAIIHALTFPGLFTSTGLLGAGPQTTAWLYMFWHGGFPLFVIAYAFLKSKDGHWRQSDTRALTVVACVAVTLGAVGVCAMLTVLGQTVLPPIMQGSHYTPAMLGVVCTVWSLSMISLVILYRQRPHSLLDIWLGVVMCAWVFDIALSVVFNAGRFDLGFYVGRIYGLVTAGGVLLVLLLENGKLYAQLVTLHAREHHRSLELAAVNRELEAFSYSVSHDLRAPLRAIDGFGKALQSRIGDHSDDVRHYLDRIRTATQRMGMLIDDLINLSRMTRAPLRPEPVDVSRLCREILARLAESEPDRDVTVSIMDDMVVNADPHLLGVMLENLLGNAWKYTSKQQHAAIEVGVTRVGGSQVFHVKDNGAGFNMNFAENLFSPFQRMHTEAEFPGTGIGLATVHRIVSRHGGSIRAEAEPDRGATFHFALEKTG